MILGRRRREGDPEQSVPALERRLKHLRAECQRLTDVADTLRRGFLDLHRRLRLLNEAEIRGEALRWVALIPLTKDERREGKKGRLKDIARDIAVCGYELAVGDDVESAEEVLEHAIGRPVRLEPVVDPDETVAPDGLGPEADRWKNRPVPPAE